MILMKTNSYQEMSRKAANIISAQIIMKPDCVLGLATGETPVGTYEQLIEWHKKGDLDFSRVRTVNLDEYRGISPQDKHSYRYFMHEYFFRHINVQPKNTFIPDGSDLRTEQVCSEYDRLIRQLGGIDLQLLGLGTNGHIGFNEPSDSFDMQTHCVNLDESTIAANKRFFANAAQVPRQAYTVGIKSIMQAEKIILIASGSDKAEIVNQSFTGPVTPRIPASILQLHPDFTLITDNRAGCAIFG